MDAFYASVEERDNPKLRGKPVVIGGSPRGRGVVCTANYVARKFGVRSAMPCRTAYKHCPEAIFIRPHFDKYLEASRQIKDIFLSVTELVEPLSLDEAYLDVTENNLQLSLAGEVALYLKKEIKTKTGLTASAGVGNSKLVAKMASDLDKPDGLVIVPPEKVLAFLHPRPIEKVWGIGPATAKKLHGLKIHKIGDIAQMDVRTLEHYLGQYGKVLHQFAHGIDERKVCPRRDPKSRGSETTFAEDVKDYQVLKDKIHELAQEVVEGLEKRNLSGKTITLKLRYQDFTTITRSRSLENKTNSLETIVRTAQKLLEETQAGERPVRLIGVTVSGFQSESRPPQNQLSFNFIT